MNEITEIDLPARVERNAFKKAHIRLNTLSGLIPHPLYSHTTVSVAGFYNDDGDLTCYRCGLRVPYSLLNAATFRHHREYSNICAPFQPADDVVPEVDYNSRQELLQSISEIELFPIQPQQNTEEEEDILQKKLLQTDFEIVHKLLKRENDYLKKRTTCAECNSQETKYFILPCGHLGCCQDCIKTINLCPICKVNVLDGEKIIWDEKIGELDEKGLKIIMA